MALFLWLGLAPCATAAPPQVDIIVDGVSGTIHDTVLANLSLARERNHPLLDEFRIERLHQRAPEEIRNALRPFGYYTPQVQSEISRDAGRWVVRYTVNPGRPVRVEQVSITIDGPGADDPVLQAWRDSFPLAPGDILLDQVYEEAKEGLLRTGRERGYLYGFLPEHEIRVTAAAGTAEIRLRYSTGERMRFGAVTFSAEEALPLQPSLLARYPDFAPGEPYDAEKLYQLHRELTGSDYFQRVEVVPLTETPADGQVPVEVELEMRKRDRYTAGVGYGTDTGPRATLGFERRWVNGYGHRFSSEALISDVRQGVSANYRIPLARPATDSLDITGGRLREDTTSYIRDTSSVAGSVTALDGGWTRTVSLNYQEENYEFADATTSRATMFYPGVMVQRVEADDRFFPSRGWRFRMEARIAAEEYYSSTSLLQGAIGGKMVVPLWGGRLMPRFDLAASYVTDFDKLPASLRYFAGGDQSVRGFAYQSLGPTDGDGEVIGGPDLLVGSLEYDHFITPKVGLALFTDVGNAFASFDDYDLHQGAGIGLRWRLPFGVVRLDAASAVSDPDRPWRFHFTIGPDL